MFGKPDSTFRRDALRRPCRLRMNIHFGPADGLECGEAILDECRERGIFGGIRIRQDDRNGDAMARRDTGYARTGSFRIRRDGDRLNQAKVDDVEQNLGLITVAEGGENAVFGKGRC